MLRFVSNKDVHRIQQGLATREMLGLQEFAVKRQPWQHSVERLDDGAGLQAVHRNTTGVPGGPTGGHPARLIAVNDGRPKRRPRLESGHSGRKFQRLVIVANGHTPGGRPMNAANKGLPHPQWPGIGWPLAASVAATGSPHAKRDTGHVIRPARRVTPGWPGELDGHHEAACHLASAPY